MWCARLGRARKIEVSLSWGGPGAIPHRFEIGKQQLEFEFGIKVVPTQNALRDAEWIKKNPKARAEDLMEAFADPTIKGIFSTIGGDDSIRILPFLELDLIRSNPKIFLGFSDTTITHFACWKAGLGSFYGSSIMCGFAENGGMFPYFVDSVRSILFSAAVPGVIRPNDRGWTTEHLEWKDHSNQFRTRKLQPSAEWKFHQEREIVRGRLIGGCFEVLDWLRGSDFWPPAADWDGAILFIESSEEAPPPIALARFIRTLGTLGVLERLAGILFGRPGGQISPDEFGAYDDVILSVVRNEQNLQVPIVTQMDFGHTDPGFVLPYGILAEIDSASGQFSLLESATVDYGETKGAQSRAVSRFEEIGIRFATGEDAEILGIMNAQLIEDENHENPMTGRELIDRMRNWIVTCEYHAVIFEKNDSTVGYALYKNRGKGSVYLRQFFVVRANRRQKVGTAAMRLLIENVWERGTRVSLETLIHNERARKFWASINFAPYSLELRRHI
jgi:muramoyltetrapeptide carboxypeptidase LdcA involved in peptidoglycan recycling/GNAT superfamily N-acetyltransferase